MSDIRKIYEEADEPQPVKRGKGLSPDDPADDTHGLLFISPGGKRQRLVMGELVDVPDDEPDFPEMVLTDDDSGPDDMGNDE